MSHPIPTRDYGEDEKRNSPHSRALRKKMSPIVHNSPVFKEARKAMQGINSTKAGAISKSLRRHSNKDKTPY